MDFYKRVGIVCRRIPAGRVATYGQIAALCGMPRNARQVGYALKYDLAGDDLPAHRVVNAKGELVGAIYFDTPDQQTNLLAAEGVPVKYSDGLWRVRMRDCAWVPDDKDFDYLEAAFWIAEHESDEEKGGGLRDEEG